VLTAAAHVRVTSHYMHCALGRDEGKLDAPATTTTAAAAAAAITGAYFPLLSVVVPKWKQQIVDSGDFTCEKVSGH
jgi:hypothetical protein